MPDDSWTPLRPRGVAGHRSAFRGSFTGISQPAGGEWVLDLSSVDPNDGLAELSAVFATRFGRSPVLAARAPGRVNLIGEHTDYNDGLVLPCAIDRSTLVVAAAREDGRVRVWSENEGEQRDFEIAPVAARCAGAFKHWSDYVKGVVFALAERGHPTPGLDLAVASQVPIGAGLSSSAAFTVSLATVFGAASGANLSPRERADVAHRAESHYLGVGSGILDPYASALGERDRALRIDCRSRELRRVPLPKGRLALLLADSGVRRSLAVGASGYRRRVSECAAALSALGAAWRLEGRTLKSLRDLEVSDLPKLEALLDPMLLRRVRHVVSENQRVIACCAAFEAGDLEKVGAMIRAGHESLREDYEVSVPELDLLCAIGDAQPGVYGSRLTGAGWGGCTLHLVDPDAARDVSSALASAFEKRFGRRPPIARVVSADGARVIDL